LIVNHSITILFVLPSHKSGNYDLQQQDDGYNQRPPNNHHKKPKQKILPSLVPFRQHKAETNEMQVNRVSATDEEKVGHHSIINERFKLLY